jgi:hypothetical protein
MRVVDVLEHVQAHDTVKGLVIERQRTALEIVHMTDRIAFIPCYDLVAVPDVERLVIVTDLLTEKSRLIARSNVKDSPLKLHSIVVEQIVRPTIAVRISSTETEWRAPV